MTESVREGAVKEFFIALNTNEKETLRFSFKFRTLDGIEMGGLDAK